MCVAPPGSRPAALVLLLLASCAPALISASYCERLTEQQQNGEDGRAMAVRVNGRELGVALLWGAAPARAGAALLAAALRYRRVRLAQAHHRLVDLARHDANYSGLANYDELAIVVSAAWAGENGSACVTSDEDECGVAGPRLRDFGASTIPARARLHVRRASAATPARCKRDTQWSFYTDASSLTDCHFLQHNRSAIVYYPDEKDRGLTDTALKLQKRAEAASLLLHLQPLKRLNLFQELSSNSTSFLFLDYDIWEGEPGVWPVASPPCCEPSFRCREEIDPSEALRAVDSNILTPYAPRLFDTFHMFHPSPQSLRAILKNEADGMSVEEAACKWALHNKDWFPESQNVAKLSYFLVVILCENDINLAAHEDLINITQTFLERNSISRYYHIHIESNTIRCDAPKAATAMAESFMGLVKSKRIIGFVAPAEEEGGDLAAYARRSHLPLVLYDSPADTIDTSGTQQAPAWSSVGRLRPLALVVRRLATTQNWTRLAVLSDPTPFARDFFNVLKDLPGDFALRDFPIRLNLSSEDATSELQKLRDVNARIVFVNTKADVAATILLAAAENNMMNDEYAWIVRDWPPSNNTLHARVLSISYWCFKDHGVASDEGLPELRAEMNRLWPAREWPPRAAALADAILTTTYGFQEVLRNQTSIIEYDLHTKQTFTKFERVLKNMQRPGVLRNLSYESSSWARARPRVYVDKWAGAERTSLGHCEVNDTQVKCVLEPVYDGAAPADGTPRCMMRGDDAFWPRCHDTAWIAAVVVAALLPFAAYLARYAVLHYLRQRDHKLLLLLVARRERAVEALHAHLVSRSALELREELGAGRFGRVHLALMRASGRTRVVAAKSLRSDAAPTEESEFLREACMLAALEHQHIVRLVGVCADGGPTLVLMEHAFFGDLLRYLRARRHLAEAAPDGSEEAANVSPEALTRLAREAASALGYLALRGLVHRDVCAANCLVDVRRSLKLADFGMARETVAAGADGAAEYACRRRALFPVLWMAPESLARGVFSAASDVWALGVLLLELVTLGQRPYGDMSPLRVLQYVAAGGRPPLPIDTTPQTRGVALACWQRAAEQRPSAAELVSYLAAHPRALRPALRGDATDADSGFGEAASPDLPPLDGCLDELDCAASGTYT